MQHYQPCSEEEEGTGNQELVQAVKVLEERLADAVADKEELAQRCHELDMQVSVIASIINNKNKTSFKIIRLCSLIKM